MASTDPVALLRATLERYLEESPLDFTVDDDEDFVVTRGSAVAWIRPLPWADGQTLVRIWSITNVGVRVDGELTRFLAVESGTLPLGAFSLEESRPAVQLGHTLLGDFLSRSELEEAVEAIVSTADHYDELIEARFGSSRFAPSAAEEPDALPHRTHQAVFGGLGVLVGIAAAIAAYAAAGSIVLAIYAFLMAAYLVARALADVLSDPQKPQRALYFLLLPALSTAILWGVYVLWERWWLAALLGFLVGGALWQLVAPRLFPRIHREEQEDTARRIGAS